MTARHTIFAALVCLFCQSIQLAANQHSANQAGRTLSAKEFGGHTVVLVNANLPESLAIGKIYAAKRLVPNRNICVVNCPYSVEISWGEYDKKIRGPLTAFLRNMKPEGIRAGTRRRIDFLAVMPGMPYRVKGRKPGSAENQQRVKKIQDAEQTPRGWRPFRTGGASLETELAVIPVKDWWGYGAKRNPFFGSTKRIFAFDHAPVLMVGRLDSFSVEDARNLLERALTAERFGIEGNVYIDTGGYTDPSDRWHYTPDQWMLNAGKTARALGYEVVIDRHWSLFRADYRFEDMAFYFGWYCGQAYGAFNDPTFRLRPGAVAFHLHSSSGASLTRPRCWVSAFLRRGATGTFGPVFEPLVVGVPRPDIFMARLTQGGTYAESVFAATEWISWATCVIGDPLYRPFDPNIVAARGPDADPITIGYRATRRARRLLAERKSVAAVKELRSAIDQLDVSDHVHDARAEGARAISLLQAALAEALLADGNKEAATESIEKSFALCPPGAGQAADLSMYLHLTTPARAKTLINNLTRLSGEKEEFHMLFHTLLTRGDASVEDKTALLRSIARMAPSPFNRIAEAESWNLHRSEPKPPRMYVASPTAKPPKIDGNLTADDGWRKSRWEGGMVEYSTGSPPPDDTRFAITYDNDYVYLAVRAKEKQPGAVLSYTSKRDGAIWADDSIELFLSPARDYSDYYQIILGLNGAVYDGRRLDPSWRTEIVTATKKNDEGWTLEASIALAGMKAKAAAGGMWGLNLVRNDYTVDDVKQGNKTIRRTNSVIVAWSPPLDSMGKALHKPEYFGWLFFSDRKGAGKQE